MGQTIVEKVFSRHNKEGTPVKAGDIIEAKLDAVRFQYGFGPRIKRAAAQMGFPDGLPKVFDKDKVYVVVDHHQPALTQELADSNVVTRQQVKYLGLTTFQDAIPGIGHQMIMDKGLARPGMLMVGVDSHTISYGALNCLSRADPGGGAVYAAMFGDLWFEVPKTIRVFMTGRGPTNFPISKDIVLYLAGKYGDDFGQASAVEFGGPAVDYMSIDTRTCLADHGVEFGAQYAIFPFDPKTKEYFRNRTTVPYEPANPDPDAHYDTTIELDIDEVPFVVAKPHRFGNVCPVSEVAGTKIDQAMIGSCANGRYEDIEIAARVLEGRKVATTTRFLVSPASQDVYLKCLETGVAKRIVEAGGQFLTPGCGICQPQVGFLSAGETAISATTRNYRGRKGSLEANIYLGGPLTVAAAAVVGELADPMDVFPELKR